MNGKKTIGLLGLSIGFIFICLLLLATWLYFFFRTESTINNSYQQPVIKQVAAADKKTTEPDAAVVQGIRDSLQQLYAITTRELDSQIDSTRSNLDTLKSHLDTKLSESAGLRSEILDILKNNNSGNEGMELARLKITMLQQKVNELRRINADVEIENRRLRALLNQIGSRASETYQPAVYSNTPEKAAPEANTGNQSLNITDLRLTAVQLNDDREQETTQAQQADRFVGSFTVKTNAAKTANTEIVVVVLQPDGQVLQNSTWESGTFETREGKRVYSLKVKCENAKDTPSPYRFHLNAERFQKGNYTLQIYQNGNIIGRLVKTLS
jgi:regulator of replication initiation timing